MNADQAKALRAPLDPRAIGKLPKPTSKDNPKGRCNECGGWHGLPAVHLDYAGHAAVTDRLLAVDPDWTWTPLAIGPHGGPQIVDNGLWIMLTVCGVTRPGFGDASGGKGPKEMIGDAIRNAAMRFGVGLDLWAKEDLHAVQDSREADERAAKVSAELDAETERLIAAVGKPDGEPELRASVAAHRAKATPENHAAWLAKCITKAEAASSGGGSPEAPDAAPATASENARAAEPHAETPLPAPDQPSKFVAPKWLPAYEKRFNALIHILEKDQRVTRAEVDLLFYNECEASYSGGAYKEKITEDEAERVWDALKQREQDRAAA